jgi:LmbE family N-acetylglucosaminyl deacetylase
MADQGSASFHAGLGTIIYYVPHPDDEVLTYGVPIIRDIKAGKNVHVVLVTTQTSQKLMNKINNNLTLEGHEQVNLEEIRNYRANEFKLATMKLGVKQENIHDVSKQLLLKNIGKFNEAEFDKIIISFETKYPNSLHVGMDSKDVQPDHAVIGKVLKKLSLQGKINKYELYGSVYMTRLKKKGKLRGEMVLIQKDQEINLKEAAKVYQTWDPKNRRYSAGYTSVKAQFDSVVKYPFSIVTEKKY